MFEIDEARRDELIDRWARRIVARGLGLPAVFLLEAHKPVAALGAQAVLALQPLLVRLLRWDPGELAAFLYRPDNLERLARKIEQLQDENRGGTGP